MKLLLTILNEYFYSGFSEKRVREKVKNKRVFFHFAHTSRSAHTSSVMENFNTLVALRCLPLDVCGVVKRFLAYRHHSVFDEHLCDIVEKQETVSSVEYQLRRENKKESINYYLSRKNTHEKFVENFVKLGEMVKGVREDGERVYFCKKCMRLTSTTSMVGYSGSTWFSWFCSTCKTSVDQNVYNSPEWPYTKKVNHQHMKLFYRMEEMLDYYEGGKWLFEACVETKKSLERVKQIHNASKQKYAEVMRLFYRDMIPSSLLVF